MVTRKGGSSSTGWRSERARNDAGTIPWTMIIVMDNDAPGARHSDPVHSPQHYAAGMPRGVEAIDIIRSQGWDTNYYLGNACKYLMRCEHKGNKAQDLRKALVYIAWELERLEGARG